MKNKQNPKQAKKPVLLKEKSNTTFNYAVLFGILFIALLSYLPALNNGFVWDDDDYIKNNLLIRSINLKDIFSTNLMGNYHPLTVLVYAIQYKFFDISEKGYHAFNIFLHLLNVLLVFFAVFRLSNKSIVALVAALLFALHPMHVESVAWASELKDLLYTFFFLASYIFYLKFQEDPKNKYYAFAVFLFLLSLLSKAMAASLPLLLVLTDFFKVQKITAKSLLQKVPFFLLSFIFGIVAVQAQKSSGAVDTATFDIGQRIIFASYGFITYLVKLALPLQLCSYYAYPISSKGTIPPYYYGYLFLVIALAIGAFYSLRKTKKIFFSIGFFTVTVLLVLQLLPVGWAIMADRYSYIPSIGIFYLVGEGIYWLWNKKSSGYTYKGLVVLVLISTTIFYSVKTSARCAVWKDGFVLWNDVINQYQTIPQAYINRGIIYMNNNKTAESLADYNKAISLEPDFSKGYSNRAIVYTNENKFDLAIQDYEKAIKLDPKNAIAFNNRGILYKKNNLFKEATENFNEAIKLKPTYVDAFHNRGVSLYNLGRYDEALSDFNTALKFKPNVGRSIFFRGLVENAMGNKDVACRDLQTAVTLGYPQAAEQYNNLCK